MRFALRKTAGYTVGGSSGLVIALLGPSGAGKSTFINALLGGVPRAGVSHDFDSGTTALEAYTFPEGELKCIYPNLSKHSLVLLDTPGFQNVYDEDARMLTQLADWLAASDKEGRILIGIIYLFPIFPVKMTLSERQNLELLPQLFGGAALSTSRLFPVTSRWDMCTPAIGERREDELCQKFWNSLLPHGASPHRFANSAASARHIAKSIINQYLISKDSGSYSKPLTIQQEQVDGRTRPHFIARLLTRQRRTHEAKERSLILVMGETGAGKSTFVNDLAGEQLAAINSGLTGTKAIDYYNILLEDGSSVTTFVDCPGYNHTDLTDREISALIRDFLAKSPFLFAPESKVIGVVCLIDLSQPFHHHAEWHSIFSNEDLKCPKLLAVTHCHSEEKMQATIPIWGNKPVIQGVQANGTRITRYTYRSSNYALPLVQSMFLVGEPTPHITLRTFLGRVLPR